MGGKHTRNHTCITCGEKCYGEMCQKCRAKFRNENRFPYYHGTHRLVPCSTPGCDGLMYSGADMCLKCYKQLRKTGGTDMALRKKVGNLITVTCHTCRRQFTTVKDWLDRSTTHRGLWHDKPDYFYCSEQCHPAFQEKA